MTALTSSSATATRSATAALRILRELQREHYDFPLMTAEAAGVRHDPPGSRAGQASGHGFRLVGAPTIIITDTPSSDSPAKTRIPRWRWCRRRR